MQYKKILWVVLFGVIIPISSVFCGPFGLDMGMSLAEIKQRTGRDPILMSDDMYEIIPPNTNNLFETYLVRVHPTLGLYFINVIGKEITTNGYGFDVKSTFNDLVASIERTYGKYKKYDFLMPRSIWDEPDDFMMGLVKEERYLASVWDKDEGSTLPDDIANISVSARGLSSSKGVIVLQYTSPNKEIIDAEKKAIQDSVF